MFFNASNGKAADRPPGSFGRDIGNFVFDKPGDALETSFAIDSDFKPSAIDSPLAVEVVLNSSKLPAPSPPTFVLFGPVSVVPFMTDVPVSSGGVGFSPYIFKIYGLSTPFSFGIISDAPFVKCLGIDESPLTVPPADLPPALPIFQIAPPLYPIYSPHPPLGTNFSNLTDEYL